MKYILLILCSCCLMSEVLAQSAGYEPKSSYRGAYRHQVQRDFESDFLAEENINAYEYRAQQKVRDFADYINLIANADYDMQLRKHAIGLVKKMFENEQVSIQVDLLTGVKMKTYKVGGFLDAVLHSHYTKIEVNVGAITVVNGLSPTLKKNYMVGSLNADYVCTHQREEATTTTTSTKPLIEKVSQDTWKVNIVLKKIKKKFGQQEQEIWEVFLSNIEMQEKP